MRSKDRLAELRRLAEQARVSLEPEPEGRPGGKAPLATDPDIDAIFQEAERMRSCIDEINGNTQLMRRLHADPSFHGNTHLQEQLEGCVARSGGAARRGGEALRRLQGAAGGEGGAGGAGRGARGRIARWQAAAAHRLYSEALHAHAAALDALRDERRLLLREQIRLTDRTITEEECEDLLESKELSLFVDNVRADSAAARRALRAAEARHAELARLERALGSLREQFVQLAQLVSAQQARVDSVEYYALQATEHVESGQHELLKGTVSRARARKKKMSLFICLAVGFLVVLLVLVLT